MSFYFQLTILSENINHLVIIVSDPEVDLKVVGRPGEKSLTPELVAIS